MHSLPSFSLLVLLAFSMMGSFSPAHPSTGVMASDPPSFSAWLVTPSPAPLCPGDRVAISVRALEKNRNVPVNGYPMNITQSQPAVGHLDPVSKVVVNGAADFVYIANDGASQGTLTDTLTFRIGGYPTGLTVPVTVYGSCDYKLTLLMQQFIQDQTTYLYSVVNGELTLKRTTGQAHGEGNDDVFLTMGDSGDVIACWLEPDIQGSGAFQADSTFNPVTPGVETMTFDLIFDRVKLNDATLKCEPLIGGMNIKASYPFNVGYWDPDQMNLQGISVTLNGGFGSVPVSYETMNGDVFIEREVHP